MTEHKDDDQENTSNTIHPKNTSGEASPTSSSQKGDINPSADPMEVHHHAHHGHEKRNWKSYFWEFLMLFLAVFCGYLAESYHTHSVNKEIEMRNMELVVDNLRDDVEKFKINVRYHMQKVKILDTLISFRNSTNIDTLNSKTFGYLFSKSIYNPVFVSNTAAIDQMKSSGSLRLVQNKEILGSIFKYVSMSNLLSMDRDRLNSSDDKWIENASAFLDMQYLASSRKLAFLDNSPLKHQNFDANRQQLQQFFNYAIMRKSILEVLLLPRMDEQQKNAEDLIKLLEKEYDIKHDHK